ncbi:MAG: hypothetical protein NC112_07460 [Oxalobacter formigenes]|nr:hypothetical protein [Oxalobacter formigenes]
MKKPAAIIASFITAALAASLAQADPVNYDTRTMKEQQYRTKTENQIRETNKRNAVKENNNGTYSTAERPNYGSRSASNLDRNPNKPINQQP